MYVSVRAYGCTCLCMYGHVVCTVCVFLHKYASLCGYVCILIQNTLHVVRNERVSFSHNFMIHIIILLQI